MKYLLLFLLFLSIYISIILQKHTQPIAYIYYIIGKEGRLKFIGHPLIKSSEFNIFTLSQMTN